MDGCGRNSARRACTPRVSRGNSQRCARLPWRSVHDKEINTGYHDHGTKHTTPVVHGNRIGGETSTRTRRHRRRRSARCDSRLQLKYYNEQSAYVLSPLLPYSQFISCSSRPLHPPPSLIPPKLLIPSRLAHSCGRELSRRGNQSSFQQLLPASQTKRARSTEKTAESFFLSVNISTESFAIQKNNRG